MKAVEEPSGSEFVEAELGFDNRPITPGFSSSVTLKIKVDETPVVPGTAIGDNYRPTKTAFEDGS